MINTLLGEMGKANPGCQAHVSEISPRCHGRSGSVGPTAWPLRKLESGK